MVEFVIDAKIFTKIVRQMALKDVIGVVEMEFNKEGLQAYNISEDLTTLTSVEYKANMFDKYEIEQDAEKFRFVVSEFTDLIKPFYSDKIEVSIDGDKMTVSTPKGSFYIVRSLTNIREVELVDTQYGKLVRKFAEALQEPHVVANCTLDKNVLPLLNDDIELVAESKKLFITKEAGSSGIRYLLSDDLSKFTPLKTLVDGKRIKTAFNLTSGVFSIVMGENTPVLVLDKGSDYLFSMMLAPKYRTEGEELEEFEEEMKEDSEENDWEE